MLVHLTPRDITGTVNVEDSGAVADACVALLAARFGRGAIDSSLLQQAFRDVRDAFWGDDAEYLACDTPYHDLRHSLDTALLAARLVDGHAAGEVAAGPPGLGPELATLTVLLALMHDAGFLRRTDEPPGPGARLMADHEARSVRFAERYLARTPLAAWAARAVLIESTRVGNAAGATIRDLPPALAAAATLIGTADLLAQFADRAYLEKCYHHLYAEFVDAGLARPIGEAAGGDVHRPAAGAYCYDSPQDLLRKTPAFFASVIRPRLDDDFAGSYRYLANHFGGRDPYMASVEDNLRHLDALLAADDFTRLRRCPRPLLRDLPRR